MAQGILESFDNRLSVSSAGTNPGDSINEKAVMVMSEIGIDISENKPKPVEIYLTETWDYVITVCDEANETCPVFSGNVKNRLHIAFEDPSKAMGSDIFIMNEYRKVRDEILERFKRIYHIDIKPELNGQKS
jgi:arsenate reductase